MAENFYRQPCCVLAELAKLQPLFETPLADFSRTNPGVEVLATSGCNTVVPEAIQKRNLDIAIYSAPDGIPGKTFLEQIPAWVASEAMPPFRPSSACAHQSWLLDGRLAKNGA